MPKMRKKRERFDVIRIFYEAVPLGRAYMWRSDKPDKQRRSILSRHLTRQEANAARDRRLVLEAMNEAAKSIAVYVMRVTTTLAKRPN